MHSLLGSDIFRNAFVIGSLAALCSSLVGYFLVLRAQAFAAEALTDVSFAGATGAALAGLDPLWGMLGLTALAALALGTLSEKARGRDVEIGMILSAAMGLGLLFLSLYSHHSASHATAGVNVLFGSILSVQTSEIRRVLVCAFVTIVVLSIVSRPLLFSTIDPVVARARGLPTTMLSVTFVMIAASATAIAVLSVGALLAVSLLVAPAAAAICFSRNPVRAILLSALFGLIVVWGGLFISFLGPWRHPPVGFSISTLAAMMFLVARVSTARRRAKVPSSQAHPTLEMRGE